MVTSQCLCGWTG